MLLVPSLLLVGQFFLKTCPSMIPVMTRGQCSRTVTVIGLTVARFFMFFGIAGLLRAYGAVSQAFSVISVVIRTSEPDRYIVNPIHQMPRLKHLGQTVTTSAGLI
jgi:hypothetical protein